MQSIRCGSQTEKGRRDRLGACAGGGASQRYMLSPARYSVGEMARSGMDGAELGTRPRYQSCVREVCKRQQRPVCSLPAASGRRETGHSQNSTAVIFGVRHGPDAVLARCRPACFLLFVLASPPPSHDVGRVDAVQFSRKLYLHDHKEEDSNTQKLATRVIGMGKKAASGCGTLSLSREISLGPALSDESTATPSFLAISFNRLTSAEWELSGFAFFSGLDVGFLSFLLVFFCFLGFGSSSSESASSDPS
eukprot:906099-Rhodomonas_salina.1